MLQRGLADVLISTMPFGSPTMVRSSDAMMRGCFFSRTMPFDLRNLTPRSCS